MPLVFLQHKWFGTSTSFYVRRTPHVGGAKNYLLYNGQCFYHDPTFSHPFGSDFVDTPNLPTLNFFQQKNMIFLPSTLLISTPFWKFLVVLGQQIFRTE